MAKLRQKVWIIEEEVILKGSIKTQMGYLVQEIKTQIIHQKITILLGIFLSIVNKIFLQNAMKIGLSFLPDHNHLISRNNHAIWDQLLQGILWVKNHKDHSNMDEMIVNNSYIRLSIFM